MLAFCVELLCKGKFSRDMASKWVVTQARLRGMSCEDGVPATEQQIAGWHSEIKKGKGRAPAGACELFQSLTDQPQMVSGLPR